VRNARTIVVLVFVGVAGVKENPMVCSNCGVENLAGGKFCFECGSPLTRACPSCGSAVMSVAKFCSECGATLAPTELARDEGLGARGSGDATSPTAGSEGASSGQTATELRLVSVLFCDLVGFTPLAESLDPEEVRELLSGYFDLARGVVARYGGFVEKFIGDAVMAVWGVPAAQEDDAERAVRAGLDLVAAVASFGSEHGTDLAARVGIVTGQAATTGMPEEGFVVGDRVNTAARIQAAAPPGCCYVDEATRRATDAAIVYSDAGPHELKGKAEPVQLYQALRVIAGVGGALKSEGLEAPFVGRDRELRLVKDLFHASAEERRAHLVSVTGIAGIGKSRLAWEFYKYMDGLSSFFLWHRGRCLSYGEGVAYWALAEMVRGRAGILEGEDATSAAGKLHAAVEQRVTDPEERKWVEPRLAHLIGLEERVARDKEDLFAAWRLFFERMAEVEPVVMSFEDMQWADASLLDFIEYLLDWSRNHPIFVLTLARPELVDRRPSWGAGRRNFTSIYLEPLSEKAMWDLITGLVPGLPDEVSEQILARAEGVPLYAVETVRMLIDRGLLVREGSSYQPTGTIGALEVPETLHALIAARLDGLSAAERGLLQDAAVIGKSFSKESLLALTGVSPETLDELLASLVRKEVLSLQSDPRSPERGQYGFLQDLVRAVAYEMLAKRDRKDKHLAVAAYLSDGLGSDEQEIIEVVASHYLKAYQLAPDAADAEAVKAKARDLNVRAGERAASLAASEEAERYFEQALELSDDPSTRAAMAERAGEMAWLCSHRDTARTHFEAALSMLAAMGDTHASARVTARLGVLDQFAGHLEVGIERMEQAFEVLAGEDHDEDFATLAAELARLHFFHGDRERALSRVETALEVAEKLALPEQLSQALNTKAMMLLLSNRREEAGVLLQHALQVALDNGRHQAALRGYNNLIYSLETRDRYAEAWPHIRPALELARRAGDRLWEGELLSGEITLFISLGSWQEAIERAAEIERSEEASARAEAMDVLSVVEVHIHRGDLETARQMVDRAAPFADSSDDVQIRGHYAHCLSLVLRAEGELAQALAAAEVALQSAGQLGATPVSKLGMVEAIDAALALGDATKAEGLLQRIEQLAPGEASPFLQAHGLRFRARLSPDEDDATTSARLSTASAIFRDLAMPFWLAVTLLEHAEWLAARDRSVDAEPLVDEAREIFERLGARPWLERIASAWNRETISA